MNRRAEVGDSDAKVFSASWDRGMWVLNSILLLAMAGVTAVLVAAALKEMRENTIVWIIGWAAALMPGAVLIIAAVFAPLRYEMRGDNILVKRFLSKAVRIPLDEVYSVEAANYEYVFKKSFRVMGSGGGFGIYARFTSANLERFKAYMTRRSKLVLINTVDMPFVITPDDPEGFVAAVRAEIMKRGS